MVGGGKGRVDLAAVHHGLLLEHLEAQLRQAPAQLRHGAHGLEHQPLGPIPQPGGLPYNAQDELAAHARQHHIPSLLGQDSPQAVGQAEGELLPHLVLGAVPAGGLQGAGVDVAGQGPGDFPRF